MKFTQPVADAIIKDIQDEVPYEIACESNGVSYSTFRLWLENGKKEINEGKFGYYAQFLQAIRDVQKNRVKSHLNNIRDNDEGHKGAQWTLERAYWKYFSPKVGEIDLNERVERLESMKSENLNANNAEEKTNDNEK